MPKRKLQIVLYVKFNYGIAKTVSCTNRPNFGYPKSSNERSQLVNLV